MGRHRSQKSQEVADEALRDAQVEIGKTRHQEKVNAAMLKRIETYIYENKIVESIKHTLRSGA